MMNLNIEKESSGFISIKRICGSEVKEHISFPPCFQICKLNIPTTKDVEFIIKWNGNNNSIFWSELKPNLPNGNYNDPDSFITYLTSLADCGSTSSNQSNQTSTEADALRAVLSMDGTETYFVNSVFDSENQTWIYKRADNGNEVAPGIDFQINVDLKTIDFCYFLEGNPNRYFKELICLRGSNVVSQIIWESGVGTISSLPDGVAKCSNAPTSYREFLGTQLLDFDSTSTKKLNAPQGSNLAEIQVQGCDLTWLFGSPVNGGYNHGIGQVIELESMSEISLFEFIAKDANCTGKLVVTYYKQLSSNI